MRWPKHPSGIPYRWRKNERLLHVVRMKCTLHGNAAKQGLENFRYFFSLSEWIFFHRSRVPSKETLYSLRGSSDGRARPPGSTLDRRHEAGGQQGDNAAEALGSASHPGASGPRVASTQAPREPEPSPCRTGAALARAYAAPASRSSRSSRASQVRNCPGHLKRVVRLHRLNHRRCVPIRPLTIPPNKFWTALDAACAPLRHYRTRRNHPRASVLRQATGHQPLLVSRSAL